MRHNGSYSAHPRISWLEYLPWLVAIAGFFLLPDYLSLGARILVYVLYALSLDLVVGYAGVVTLGQSAFFGLGAYVAGILAAKLGWTDPIAELIVAVAAAAVLGLVTGAVILRTRGLTLLMLTLAIASILVEIANKATDLTGGADGLSGISLAPVFGMFRFDLYGKTAYWLCLVVLFIGWWLIRRLVYSPFGASLVGIRENFVRMSAIGSPVYGRLLTIYTVSAAIAGAAGALITQTNQFVGLNVLSFESSGELLVMLILGGVGRIYGAFLGPAVYMIAQDQLAKQFPEYWTLGIGVLLIVIVLFARDGLLGILDRLTTLARRRSAGGAR
jgi:branched-chain amino acid transport system permease protein